MRIKSSFSLEISLLDGQICLHAQWAANSLSQTHIEEYLDIFVELLTRVVMNSSSLVQHALGPLKPELDQIWAWNAVVPPTIDRCLHDIISEQAAKIPDAVAVTSWDGELSYAQINSISSHLAYDLVNTHGISLGDAVPLCFEKSRWTVVGLLAIMKAGGTFVLTDPAQPPARLSTIVEQTHAKVLLSSRLQEDLARRIAPDADIVIVSDTLLEHQLQVPPQLPPVPSSSPMYIIFTSGSTGKPKGVVLSHANYTSGAIPRGAAVGYRADLRVFEFASYAFDVSIDCMLCTLAVGGTICVPSDTERMNDLSTAIRASKCGMAHMTPSVARVLDPDIIPSLEVLGLGGEALSSGDALAWSATTSVINAYGPSECTVGCTINDKVHEGAKRGIISIGTGKGALPWITDPNDHHRLVPLGGVGELLVEGPVVGIGYLDEPEKTAEVFIEDPDWLVAGHGKIPGRKGRLYKTGDLVRYDTDGSGAIIFVGRKDQQVKIRGQRVELVEIEHHLRDKVPSGVEMVAEVIKPGGGDATLVVFLAEPSQDIDAVSGKITLSPQLNKALGEIDAALESELPRYMVPTAYIPLPAIPSLVSGKTDRKKLREIGAGMTRQQVAGFGIVVDTTRPDTETEITLERLWRQLLGGEVDTSFSLGDSFFALGGDSLKAMKLVSSARAEGFTLHIADIFNHPKLRDMASALKTTSTETNSQLPAFSLLQDGWTPEAARRDTAMLCGVKESQVEDVYPCTPLQEALMALSAKVKEAYVAQRVLEVESLSDAMRLHASFEKASEESTILRTRIVQAANHGLVQVIIRGNNSCRSAKSVQAYLHLDRNEPMDLGKPLVRYGIVEDKVSGKVHFILTIHHSLYDGWSMPLTVDRINRAYQGLPTTRQAAFKDFIRFLSSVDQDACKAYWREQLQGATGPQFPALPFEGYQAQADSLLEVFVPLPRRPASNTTVATVIRGAWALISSRYAASSDAVFGETLTGRNAPVPGVDEIEGPMITTVPVRVQIDTNATVTDYLQGIYDQTVAQIPYEHTGLQHIRRLSPDALQACELRSGLVLHPGGEDEQQAISDKDHPANDLVPAGDAEAAQEALKFNTYPIMLVCSLGSKGFLVMASYDSKTVDKPTMERVLAQFSLITRQLCEKTDTLVKDIEYLSEDDKEELLRLSKSADVRSVLDKSEQATAAWIVDPSDHHTLLPRGAVGELVIECAAPTDLAIVDSPIWLKPLSSTAEGQVGTLFRTGKMAKLLSDGSLVITGKVNGQRLSPSVSAPKVKTALSATSVKQKVVRELWSRVLRVDEAEISLHDNFFRIGGDSITAMKLVSEARIASLQLTVAQVFSNRSLFDMANAAQYSPTADKQETDDKQLGPYQSLSFVAEKIQPKLANPSWQVLNVLPTRPLQEVAVQGTVRLPRFSVRYELLHFDTPVDKARLFKACRDLIAQNEILRTVFVEEDNACFGVVIQKLDIPVVEYEIDGDVEAFTKMICKVDVQSQIQLGSTFVKWFFVTGTNRKSSLIFRISHAQYDEICLPVILQQLSALYEGRSVPKSYPFSTFVSHVVSDGIPRSIGYWRELLKGSAMTVLRPDIPVMNRRHYAIQQTVNIAARSRDVTIATLPTAAWALCLSRRLQLRDVTFGEVVSGRNIDLANCDAIVGPCWQYVPVRVRMEAGWTGADLLEAVQHQHIATSAHEGIGLPEIVRQCTDWPASTDWFDSVVHQDVEHVESLPFLSTDCRTETLYVHEEPLREWKIQAFPAGDTVTLEIVTFESWAGYAAGLLHDLVDAMETLVRQPGEVIV